MHLFAQADQQSCFRGVLSLRVWNILRKVVAEINIWAVGAAAVAIFWFWWRRPSSNYPPGPRGIPLLGVLSFLGTEPGRTIYKWSQELYGPVMSVRFGSKPVVTLNTYDTIIQAFKEQGETFSGRPWVQIVGQFWGRYGVAHRDYTNDYKIQKSFMLKAFKEFGGGNKGLQAGMDEIPHFLKKLKTSIGKPIDLSHDVLFAVGNIVTKICAGKRYDYDDPAYFAVMDAVERESNPPSPSAQIICYIVSWLRFFPPFSAADNHFLNCEKELAAGLQPIVDRHVKNFDPKKIKDVIDAFLKERMTKEPSFQEERQLLGVVRDVFHAGAQPTKIQIQWCVLALLRYPDYYKRMKEELDTIASTVSLNDRPKLPFTRAFILEVVRITTIAPIGVNHYAVTSGKLLGFEIPKGTQVLSNLWAANNDPKDWENPDLFNPDRHLDVDGKFLESSTSRVITFGVGLRGCPGADISRMMIFLVFSNLVRSFEITAEKEDLPNFNNGYNSGFYAPIPFKVILKER